MAVDSQTCPVCGCALGFDAWVGGAGSQEMCPCCGIQFGYEDAAGGNLEKRQQIYQEKRAIWIAEGMRWLCSKKKPADWDPKEQVNRVLGHTPQESIAISPSPAGPLEPR